MIKFGDRLYELRKSKGLSQDELSLAVGSTKSTISKYERNLVDPTLDSAKSIAKYFRVSLDWISGSDENEKPQFTISDDYKQIIESAIKANITPNQLWEAINFIEKIR